MKRTAISLSGLIVAGYLLTAMIANAQTPQQSPSEQALSSKLMAELQASVQCDVARITLQRELDGAKAEVKRLTDKYETKEK